MEDWNLTVKANEVEIPLNADNDKHCPKYWDKNDKLTI